jgi:lipid-A-disaccharide synthase
MTAPPKKIFIIAGESSGDALGAGLMASLRIQMGQAVEFAGIGGEEMRAQGLDSLFPISDIALMGFTEIIPHMWRLLRRLSDTCQAIAAFKPDMLITIDSPGFTKRVVQWVRQAYGHDVLCVHYVAPTVWAYKLHRAGEYAKLYDHLLTILPFEAPYFEAYRLPVTYVGHSVADNISDLLPHPTLWQEGQPLHIVLFPGSRAGEVARLLPLFQQVCEFLCRSFPKLHITLVVNELSSAHVEVTEWKTPPIITYDREAALQHAHIALTKTGTVTLQIAKAGVPMVACYKVNALTARAMRRLLRIPYVNLLNIMARRMVIPELLQERCTPEHICTVLTALVKNRKAAKTQVAINYAMLQRLRHPTQRSAHHNAAEVIRKLFFY